MARSRRTPALWAVFYGLAAATVGSASAAWAVPAPANENGAANASGPSSTGTTNSSTAPGAPQDPSAGSTSGAGDAPPGNNGHIQVDEFSMDLGSDNDPHLGCSGFSVSFFGYDGGPQSASITITPWAPTGGGHAVTLGPVNWNVGTRTSGDQLDANYPVSWSQIAPALAGVTPTAQGYHLRIEVEVTGSQPQASDDKFHMFWLGPCGPGSVGGTQGDTTTTTTSTTTTTTPDRGIVTETAGSGGGGPSLSAIDTLTTFPLLHATAVSHTATAGAAGGLLRGALAFTGSNLGPLALAGLALCGIGAALHRVGRRRRLTS